MKQKRIFYSLFFITVIILILLPFITTFNEFLTRVVEHIGIYTWIQSFIVPLEVKLVIVVLHMFNIHAYGNESTIFLVKNGAENFKAEIIWSCVGWQSAILLFFTLLTGMQGKYSFMSKSETVLIGFFATFWMNIFRMSCVYIIGYFFGQLPALLFHNYGSTLMIIAWLFFFWWFAYRFILEEQVIFDRIEK